MNQAQCSKQADLRDRTGRRRVRVRILLLAALVGGLFVLAGAVDAGASPRAQSAHGASGALGPCDGTINFGEVITCNISTPGATRA
jgi:hypothetical protein